MLVRRSSARLQALDSVRAVRSAAASASPRPVVPSNTTVTSRPRKRAPVPHSPVQCCDSTEEVDPAVAGARKDRVGLIEAPPSRRVKSELSSGADADWLVGMHVSAAGGAGFAPVNAHAGGCRAFAFFTRPNQSWAAKPLQEAECARFRAECARLGYDAARCVIPHGIYLVNLCSPDSGTANKSMEAFLDEMDRCYRLGIRMLNIHPGSSVGGAPEPAIAAIAAAINEAHRRVPAVTVVLENMAGQGSCIGWKLHELRAIIDAVSDKSRIGVCFDTCHAFAAGMDIRTADGWQRVLKEFDETVGLHFLRAMHLNDSKGPLGCRVDRHENIGRGKLGLECFRFIMNDPRFCGIPLILETPPCAVDEVRLLYSLRCAAPGEHA